MNQFKSLAILALAAFALSASAQTIPVHVSAAPLSGIGDELNSGYDQFTFNDGVAQVGFGDFKIGTFDFAVGVNANAAKTVPGTETFNFSYGSLAESIVVPFTLAIDNLDTISFDTTTKAFSFGGQTYDFTVYSFGATAGAGGTVHGDIFGGVTAAVPEPGTYALMLAGMAVVAGVARKRKQA